MKNVLILSLILGCSYVLNAQIEITDSNAEKKLLVDNDQLIVVDFYATWCKPCKEMEPIIQELAKEYGHVDFYKVDVDKNEMDETLNITTVPTYVFIKNKENLEIVQGAQKKSDLIGVLNKYTEAPKSAQALNLSQLGKAESDNNTSSATLAQTPMEEEVKEEMKEEVVEEAPPVSQSHEQVSSENHTESTTENWEDLNNLAWQIYQENNDVDMLLKGIKIVEKSIAQNENYFNLYTLSSLLYKTGNYTKALKMAKLAIDKAKVNNIDYSMTSELMDRIIEKM